MRAEMNNQPNNSVLPRTTILVNERLPKDLANIVISYFKSAKRNWESISSAGEYETCLQIPAEYRNYGLYGACFSGNIELVKLMIAHGANGWNYGLYGACFSGNIELVKLMIAHGANGWNSGLYGACLGGRIELAKLMITHGANDWNSGLCNACYAGHIELAKLMISHGATYCTWCRKPANQH